MGCIRVNASDCEYKEGDRRLKEQLTSVIDDEMMTEIIKLLTAIKKTNEITSDHVLRLAKRVK